MNKTHVRLFVLNLTAVELFLRFLFILVLLSVSDSVEDPVLNEFHS